jgi:hypothetical protein
LIRGRDPRRRLCRFCPREFKTQEQIEVAVVAAAVVMLNRLNEGLRIPFECEFEALAI